MRKLRGQLMPPPGNRSRESAARKGFISWMEGTLDKAGAGASGSGPRRAASPEPQGIRERRVRTCCDVKVDVNSLLPEDNVSDGFDNVANVLQVTPSFLDQYVAAARAVAVQAIGDASVKPMGTQYFAQELRLAVSSTWKACRSARAAALSVEHTFPADGEYELNIANMAVALWVYNMEFEHTLIATLDGKKFCETNIGGEEDMKSIDQKQDPAVDAINARLKGIRFKATAGPHKVAVAFVQRTFAESDDKLFQQLPGGGQDRVLQASRRSK